MNDVVFEPAGARILVTGATGLIGGGLARRLVALRADVRASRAGRPTPRGFGPRAWRWSSGT